MFWLHVARLVESYWLRYMLFSFWGEDEHEVDSQFFESAFCLKITRRDVHMLFKLC